MHEIMCFKIAPVISAELLALMVEQLRNNTLTEANNLLLDPLRFALVSFVLNQPEKADSFLRNTLALLKKVPDNYPLWRDSAMGQAELNKVEFVNDKPIFFGGL